MLTITTTHQPATDLGYLLHKHPDRFQTFDLSFGKAHVFYPEATEERCTCALTLDIDPVRLTARGRPRGSTPESLLEDYVNDRPYTASSHLSVAIAGVFRTAMTGRCEDRPELAQSPMPLEAEVTSVHSESGGQPIRTLLEPLGYDVSVETPPMDPNFPEWGEGRHHNVTLRSEQRTLAELLNHLYVLLPVLDHRKHHWIEKAEVEKLMRAGEGWLREHPAREVITRLYLGRRENLVRMAEALLQEEEGVQNGDDAEDGEDLKNGGGGREDGGENAENAENAEDGRERPARLGDVRLQAVADAVRETGARSVVDLGCGEGRLIMKLVREDENITACGMEVSRRSLGIATRRKTRGSLTPEQAERLSLIHGSLMYRDRRLEGFDAAVAMEVIEHIDPPKLGALEDAVFAAARPRSVIVTTPNVEYNAVYGMEEGQLRHRDHRFEWNRETFRKWAEGVAGRRGYTAEIRGVGEEDPEFGHPTQMAIFSREEPG